MKAFLNFIAITGCCVALSGCWSPRIPNTNDPVQKLAYSVELLDMKDRPPEAERLIREAIEVYRNQKNSTPLQVEQNQLGLAEAYLRYAYFFRSAAVVEWKEHYQKTGFLDKSVSYDQRLDKSLEYFNMARDIASAQNKYDILTNIDRNMAWTYIQKKDKEAACKAFDNSLADNIEFEKTVPLGTRVVLPPPYKSYAELIAAEKTDTGCAVAPAGTSTDIKVKNSIETDQVGEPGATDVPTPDNRVGNTPPDAESAPVSNPTPTDVPAP